MSGSIPVWPIAPRPLAGELCSSWLQRVAAANGLRFSDWLAPLVRDLPSDQPMCLDHDLPPGLRTALAHSCRLPETRIGELDLRCQFPGLERHWLTQGSEPHYWPHAIRTPIAPGHCVACLITQRRARLPLHLPAIWALAFVTHCPRHHSVLRIACPRCCRAEPVLEQPTVCGIVCRFCGKSLVDGLATSGEPSATTPDPTLRLEAALIAGARTKTAQGVRFLRLVLDLITLLFQEARDGLAIIDAFVWHARVATRRIAPDPSRFAHFGPFARYVVLDLIVQLLRDGRPSSDTVAQHPVWRHVLKRLALPRRAVFIAQLSGWPDHVRRRAVREMTDLSHTRDDAGPHLVSFLPFQCHWH